MPNQIKCRKTYNLVSVDPTVVPEPVKVIRRDGSDRVIVRFLTGYPGRASVPYERLVAA